MSQKTQKQILEQAVFTVWPQKQRAVNASIWACFFLCILSRTPVLGMVLPTVKEGLPTSSSLIKEIPIAQRFVTQMSKDP